jgi:hypothetical protein
MASASPDFPTTFSASSPREHSRQRPSQPLRQSSPRLFRSFFDVMPEPGSRRQATLPRPVPSHPDPLHSVNRALQNANRALQDAQEAFHQARRLRTDSEAPGQLVDLTRTSSPPLVLQSPGAAESHYISHTTHPHDSSQSHRSRRFHTLAEPVYTGTDSRRAIHHHILAANPALPPNRDRANVRFWQSYHPGNVRLPTGIFHPSVDGSLPWAVEEEAINRQRENHSNWERTQARNRERQRHQEQGQAQSPAQTSPGTSLTTLSPSSSSFSEMTTKSSRRSSAGTRQQRDPFIDEVDLTAVDDSTSLSAALSKQREEAILAQNPGTEAGRTPLTAYKCPVCMDAPTDATSTACGHVFCHRCIVDTLNWSIEQRREGAPANRKVRGVCPVCRKPLDLKDTPGTGRSLIPLELKLLVRKRKREAGLDDGKGKAKSLVKAETLSDDDENQDSGATMGRARKRERETTEDAIWRTFTNDSA